MPTGGKGTNALNSLSLGPNLSVRLTPLIQNIGNNPEITTGLSFLLRGCPTQPRTTSRIENHQFWRPLIRFVAESDWMELRPIDELSVECLGVFDSPKWTRDGPSVTVKRTVRLVLQESRLLVDHVVLAVPNCFYRYYGSRSKRFIDVYNSDLTTRSFENRVRSFSRIGAPTARAATPPGKRGL